MSARFPVWLENSSFRLFILPPTRCQTASLLQVWCNRKMKMAPAQHLEKRGHDSKARFNFEHVQDARDAFALRHIGFAQANGTAYDALRTVGNQLNRDFVNRVISVSGVDG